GECRGFCLICGPRPSRPQTCPSECGTRRFIDIRNCEGHAAGTAAVHKGDMMRIAIGGFMHESNTFAPLPAGRERFLEGSLTYGPALAGAWGEGHHELGGFIPGAAR